MHTELIFKHSGRLGDIVYALPLIQQMSLEAGKPAELFIPSDTPSRLGGDVFHPGGDRMVSAGLFAFIEPLLAVQPYVEKVHYVPAAQVPAKHIDLDQFKSAGINLKAGLIQGWYRKAFGVAFPLEKSWISLPPELDSTAFEPKFDVLMGRTTRFCNTSINYSLLDQLDRVGFIGLPFEYEDFVKRQGLKHLEYVPVTDALDLVRKMQSCRVYVGNQSVNFSLAEACKVPRALEVFEPAPVACPVGGICFEYNKTDALGNFLSMVLKRPVEVEADLNGDYYDSILPQDNWKPPFKDRIREMLGNKRKRKF
nr:hypothetical protein [uncultured Rhodoferax sp.]